MGHHLNWCYNTKTIKLFVSFELYLQKPITAKNEILKEKLEICKPWKHPRNKYTNQTDSSLKCLRLWRAHGEKLKSLSAPFGRYVFFSTAQSFFGWVFQKTGFTQKAVLEKAQPHTAPDLLLRFPIKRSFLLLKIRKLVKNKSLDSAPISDFYIENEIKQPFVLGNNSSIFKML